MPLASHRRRPLPDRTPLRGREGELVVLGDRVAALEHGRGGVLLIDAPAGGGRSRLLQEVLAVAGRVGLRALRGAGDPGGDVVPLGLLLGTLLSGPEPLLDVAALRGEAAGPGRRHGVPPELQRRLVHAAGTAPLVIAIDDLQFSDAATLAALRTLVPLVAGRPVLWVLTARDARRCSVEVRRTWDALGGADTSTLRLAPLAPAAVAQVVEDVCGAPPAPALTELVEGVGGQPRLLIDLLRGLQDDGALATRGGAVQLLDPRLPRRLRDAVGERIGALDGTARDVVQAVSAFGGRCSIDQLSQLLDRTPGQLRPALDDVLAANVLLVDDHGVAFAHALLREAADAGLPSSFRRTLCRQAVAVLVATGADAVGAAELAFAVAEPGDDDATALLRRGAAQLSGGDPAGAARLAERALELSHPATPDRTGLITETATLLWRAGRPAAAQSVAQQALMGLLDPAEEAAVRLVLARIAAMYAVSDAIRHGEAALALPDVGPPLRSGLLTTLAWCTAMTEDVEAIGRRGDAALAAARELGDLGAEAGALGVLSIFHHHRGRTVAALELADRAVALAAAAPGDAELRGPEAHWRAMLWSATGRLEEALAEADAGLRAARRRGTHGAVRGWLLDRTRLLLEAGRLDDARAEAQAALATLDELGAGDWADTTAVFALGRVAIHTGDHLQARLSADAGARLMRSESALVRHAGAWLSALLADADGDPLGAMSVSGELFRALAAGTPAMTMPLNPADLPTLARLALRAGRPEQAAIVAGAADRLAAADPQVPLTAGAAAHVRGLVDDDPAALARAVELLAPGGRLLATASALEDLGSASARIGRGDGAPERFDAALDLYVRAGATRDAARVRARLRELGVRRHRPARGGPAPGWRGLTASELEVALLVAEGATNRQVAERLFLSPHTVSTHLRHAFAKLDIRSRVELARIAQRELASGRPRRDQRAPVARPQPVAA